MWTSINDATPTGTAERILYWGGGWGTNKKAPDTLTSRGFWEKSPPENVEILMLGDATIRILGKISK